MTAVPSETVPKFAAALAAELPAPGKAAFTASAAIIVRSKNVFKHI
jgi:hypothetical protein